MIEQRLIKSRGPHIAVCALILLLSLGCPDNYRYRVCTGQTVTITFNNADCAGNCSNTTVFYIWEKKVDGTWTPATASQVDPPAGNQAIGSPPWTFTQAFHFHLPGEYQALGKCGEDNYQPCCYATVWGTLTKGLVVSRHSACPTTAASVDAWFAAATVLMQDDDGPGDEGTEDDVNACINWTRNGPIAAFTVCTGVNYNVVAGPAWLETLLNSETSGTILLVTGFWDGSIAKSFVDGNRMALSTGADGATIAHEYGHLAGLGERNSDVNAIMYGTIDDNTKEFNITEAEAVRWCIK
jgi:hypothetical protein